MINKGTTSKECPRYEEDEMSEYIILYKDNRVKRVEFIYNLERKLPKIANKVIDLEEVVMMINNIRSYLIQWQIDFETNQHFLGMKYLFWGYIIKIWTSIDFSTNKYRECNKELIRLSTEHYIEC